MSRILEVKVPDIGDFKDVEIIEVQVAAGDTVGDQCRGALEAEQHVCANEGQEQAEHPPYRPGR